MRPLKRVWKVFSHPDLRKLAHLWRIGLARGQTYKLCDRWRYHKDLLLDSHGPYVRKRMIYRVREDQYPFDVLQAALESHYLQTHEPGMEDPWISYSPYRAAAELGVCRAVADAVLLAAFQSGQYDKRIRELLLQCCGLGG